MAFLKGPFALGPEKTPLLFLCPSKALGRHTVLMGKVYGQLGNTFLCITYFHPLQDCSHPYFI